MSLGSEGLNGLPGSRPVHVGGGNPAAFCCTIRACFKGECTFSTTLRLFFQAYDATVLAASYSGPQLDILIDQGRDDQFLSASQLLPDNLIAVCSEKKIPVVFRLQPVRPQSFTTIQILSDFQLNFDLNPNSIMLQAPSVARRLRCLNCNC